MKDFFEDTIKETSKFNDAGLSISRLNDSWILCKAFIRRGKFKAWKSELDLIWLELYPDIMRKEDSKDFIKRNRKFMIDIAKSKKRSELFFNTMARHEFLREVQDLAGKAGQYIDENADDFE